MMLLHFSRPSIRETTKSWPQFYIVPSTFTHHPHSSDQHHSISTSKMWSYPQSTCLNSLQHLHHHLFYRDPPQTGEAQVHILSLNIDTSAWGEWRECLPPLPPYLLWLGRRGAPIPGYPFVQLQQPQLGGRPVGHCHVATHTHTKSKMNVSPKVEGRGWWGEGWWKLLKWWSWKCGRSMGFNLGPRLWQMRRGDTKKLSNKMCRYKSIKSIPPNPRGKHVIRQWWPMITWVKWGMVGGSECRP